MTDSVLSDITTLSVLILINTTTKRTRRLRKLDLLDPTYNQEDGQNHQLAMEILVLSLQPVGRAAHGLLHPATSEAGTAYSFH